MTKKNKNPAKGKKQMKTDFNSLALICRKKILGEEKAIKISSNFTHSKEQTKRQKLAALVRHMQCKCNFIFV